jgi:DNA-binding response OmpR family regulator
MNAVASILLVDDDPIILRYITQILEQGNYRVLTARDGVEALDVLQSHQVDLILTDIMMPRVNGYQLHECVIQNPQWVSIPVVFLTARSLDSDIRYGKEMGVDDYLTKPIAPEDLLSAVRGRLRRARLLKNLFSKGTPVEKAEPESWVLGRLRIEPEQYRVWQDEKPIKLSLKEFKLLQCLAQQANKVVPLQELIKSTHGLSTDRADASTLIRPLVRSLRRKLGYQAGNMGCIESVRGVGYQLRPRVD